MGFLSRMFGRKTTSLDLWTEVYGGGRKTTAGVNVTTNKALETATVLACVRVIANGVAQVSWPLYLQEGDKKVKAKDHPLYNLLNVAPNPRQTAFDFRRTMAIHLCLTGNAYVWQGRVGRAKELRRMELLNPSQVAVRRTPEGVMTYKYQPPNAPGVDFSEEEIWHVRNLSWDGWMGLDGVKLARESIGLSMSTQDAHASMYANGSVMSGLLSMESKIDSERYKFLESYLDKFMPGGDRAGKPLVLDMGARFTPMTMTGVDAQHLETRKHQIEEVCRAFGVLPIMIGYSDKTATYASAEQMFIAHVVHTMTPWYSLLEQSADLFLLSEQERASGYYTKFNVNAMMRGAAKDRGDFYSKALGAGGHGTAYMTPNDVRALEDMDPIEGGDTLPVGAQAGATNGAA